MRSPILLVVCTVITYYYLFNSSRLRTEKINVFFFLEIYSVHRFVCFQSFSLFTLAVNINIRSLFTQLILPSTRKLITFTIDDINFFVAPKSRVIRSHEKKEKCASVAVFVGPSIRRKDQHKTDY